ncbi:lipopolysaccharide assembly protein LapB [Clostridium sp. DJ247]|uniref:tetratricopeptide repeat protein n=1 Tax=Clostridium sp. DJ247 TaxID=2726188 RepID=UPI001624BA71|nr:tetratricopeptide repeat protein [Clostridium sp. DJ247]MBC2580424.1 tetratricopeptide repeat protein [Clostridium sp. DJ247]
MINKDKVKKIIIVSIIVIISLIGVGFGVYKYNVVQAYNNLITTANKYMDAGEYDKAIEAFKQCLRYKQDSNIDRSIKLAENLKEAKDIYDEGTKLMNDKKYLEAIEQFNKVTKANNKLYDNAQKNIQECKKQYIAQNLQLADSSIKSNKYDDANKYLDEILKIDSNNANAKKLKNDIIKSEQEKDNTQSYTNNTKITFEQASSIVLDSIKNKAPNTVVVQADKEIRNQNGLNYYVVHVVDNMADHTATRGWYYVEVNTGKAYEWDLASNKLIPLN